ncbi:hypothetical protein JTB14_023837 [Gonioctena quinquepunctata]|nr:hypothetical protein JTB14_023837 [Gonioctena quinquepunctata]
MIPAKSSLSRNVENNVGRNLNVVHNVQGNNQVYRPPQMNRFGNQDAQRHTENQNHRGNEYRNARSTPEPTENRHGQDFRQVENSTKHTNANQSSGNSRRDVQAATVNRPVSQ